MKSVTTSPSTASPRNSSRSFDSNVGFSAQNERWAKERANRLRSSNGRPSRSSRRSRVLSANGLPAPSAHPLDDVLDRVADGTEVGEGLVFAPEPFGTVLQLLLDGLHQLDEGQRVSREVLGEAGL